MMLIWKSLNSFLMGDWELKIYRDICFKVFCQ